MNLSEIKIAKSTNECVKCQGKWCKSYPGIFHPEQFKSEKEIETQLRSGHYAIDCWEEDDERSYFLRPAAKNREAIFDALWGGTCIFYGSNGCKLGIAKRPIECLALKPEKDLKCTMSIDDPKYTLAIEWEKSQFDLMVIHDRITQ